MHYAGGQASNRRKLLSSRDRTICLHACSYIFPYRNHVRNFAAVVDPHWNLTDQPMLQLPVYECGVFQTLDFAARKYASELALKQFAFLAGQDAEDTLAQNRATWDTQLTKLTITIPGNNFEVAIDRIKGKRQAVDDGLNEAALRLHFGGAPLDFFRQVSRCGARILIETGNVRRQGRLLCSGVNQSANRIVAVFTFVEGNNQSTLGTPTKPQRRRIF